jgi:hypothetical protein
MLPEGGKPDLRRYITESDGNVQCHIPHLMKTLPLRSLLIPRVIIAAARKLRRLSLLDIAFRDVRPLLFATPLEFGGLGLDPPRIGNILATYGVINGLFQILFFADLHDRFGSKIIYSAAAAPGVGLEFLLTGLDYVHQDDSFRPCD